MDFENPYEAPENADNWQEDPSDGPMNQGKVGHIRIVAVLMMVQGSLELVMALLFFASAFGMATLLEMPGMRQEMMDVQVQGLDGELNQQQQEILQQRQSLMEMAPAIYGGLGVVNLIIGGFHLTGGILNYSMRGRVLGFVSLFLGLGTLYPCICFPTALGLMIYGLIIYLDPSVKRAFRQRAMQGRQSY